MVETLSDAQVDVPLSDCLAILVFDRSAGLSNKGFKL